jgi:hypothetical protein
MDTKTISWEQSKDAVPEGAVQTTIYEENSGDRVATVFQTQANVDLITASPDLLAAAKLAEDALFKHAAESGPEREAAIALIGAIAKAEGQ